MYEEIMRGFRGHQTVYKFGYVKPPVRRSDRRRGLESTEASKYDDLSRQ